MWTEETSQYITYIVVLQQKFNDKHTPLPQCEVFSSDRSGKELFQTAAKWSPNSVQNGSGHLRQSSSTFPALQTGGEGGRTDGPK